MKDAEFQLQGLVDPRLSACATSALPAWLWSSDGARILWANAVGARTFLAANGAALTKKHFGPADAHRRQIAHLADRLPANGTIRMERLRGFGAAPGMLSTCGCSRLDFADGSRGVLVVATSHSGRAMPLLERLQRLVEGLDIPVAAFTRDGNLVGASDAAQPLLGFRDLAKAGLDDARRDALRLGRVEVPFGVGQMELQRIGTGADIGLLALFTPEATQALSAEAELLQDEVADASEPHVAIAMQSAPDSQRPARPAPAGFALFDEFTEPPVAPQGPLTVDTVDDVSSRASSDVTMRAGDVADHEPSPFVEVVADEPEQDSAGAQPRRHPLRFTWQMDREGRFWLGACEFTRLIGARTAAGFGRLWSDIAATFGLDPDDRIMTAFATQSTWSGITLNWPVDGGGSLPVELSGLPIFDRHQNFAGYRGFGMCRDLNQLSRLAVLRHESPGAKSNISNFATVRGVKSLSSDLPAPETSQQTDLEANVETPEDADKETATDAKRPAQAELSLEAPNALEAPNVLPFRPVGEPKAPSLTPVENSAFHELARQLSARLETDSETGAGEAVAEPPTASGPREPTIELLAVERPDWLAEPEPAPRGEARRDKTLLDLLPVGVLIYRLDRLVYANRAFLDQIGYESLHALEEVGGLDALYVEPGISNASSTSDAGKPVTISASQSLQPQASSSPADARLHTISWDGEPALALIFSGPRQEDATVAAEVAEAAPLVGPPPAGHADAEELGAILDTTAEGIVMFDAEGNINSANRSAEALFGYDGAELVQRNLAELFAPESQRDVLGYLDSVKSAGVASLLDHGREALGRVRQGGIVPLSVTMGSTRVGGPNFFAVFRDLSHAKKSEGELREAQRLADRAANAKADMLARLSHEVRTPLNAIIGFAEMMSGERFGALGNERYIEYMKDIRASGERVISIINDLVDLSRIETGKLELAFTSQNLNELVESCVTLMQPQANRERIIIRTSLAHALPQVLADARALRQITLNLIGNSIHLANAGGQVIVSTALSDFGEVVLRVRDTGHGLNDHEVAATLEPFRTNAPSDQAADGAGVSLSLTKALVEANRGKFKIKTGGRSGTLIEVVFATAFAKA